MASSLISGSISVEGKSPSVRLCERGRFFIVRKVSHCDSQANNLRNDKLVIDDIGIYLGYTATPLL